MKKKSLIQLLVLIVVLAAMIIGYFVMKNYNKQHPQKSTSATQAEMAASTEAATIEVTNFATDDVTGVSVEYNGKTVNLQKLNNKWQNTDKNTAEIDTDKVTSFLTTFTKVKASEKIADVKDLAKYGLDKPAAVVTITTYNNTFKISLGTYNSMIQKYYLGLGTSSTIYTVSADVFEACKKTAADFEKTAANATSAASTAAAETISTTAESTAAATESTETAVDSSATLNLTGAEGSTAAASASAAK